MKLVTQGFLRSLIQMGGLVFHSHNWYGFKLRDEGEKVRKMKHRYKRLLFLKSETFFYFRNLSGATFFFKFSHFCLNELKLYTCLYIRAWIDVIGLKGFCPILLWRLVQFFREAYKIQFILVGQTAIFVQGD